MSDTWDTATATLTDDMGQPGGPSAIQNGGYRLFSGSSDGGNDLNALTNVGHNLQLQSNKFYFEVAVDEDSITPGADGVAIGIDTVTNFAPEVMFSGPDGLNLYSDGNVYNVSTIVHTIPVAPVNGLNGIVGVAVGAGQIWWRINGGAWNGIPTADPAKGIQGFTIPVAPIHWIFGNVGCEDDGHASIMDINTGPIFTYPPPVGFAPWAAIVSAGTGTSNPPGPNAISPGGNKGIRWSYTDSNDW